MSSLQKKPNTTGDIKKYVIGRPASMLNTQIDNTKAKVLGDFNRFLESDADFRKHDQVYKRPPIFNAGKAKIKKAMKQFMINDTGNTINGRLLTSPSPNKVIKAMESPKPWDPSSDHPQHTLAKTMNEN